MEWDRAVSEELERMTIFQRERLRGRIEAHVAAAGRERVTLDDLAAVRGGGMATRRRPEPLLDPLDWPVLAGRYELIDAAGPVAVCTLANEQLVRDLGRPSGTAIVGSAFTENLGVEKLAINIVANPAIRVLVLCGTESRHRVGQTLRALHANGVDEHGRIVGSEGPLPLVPNLPAAAVAIFRSKLRVIDMVGENEPARIAVAIASAIAGDDASPWQASWRPEVPELIAERDSGPVRAEDPAGFLLLALGPRRDRIMLEHYSNDSVLRARISARSAEALCRSALEHGVVGTASHAAYLGREAARAEIALVWGIDYEQDRPPAAPRGEGRHLPR